MDFNFWKLVLDLLFNESYSVPSCKKANCLFKYILRLFVKIYLILLYCYYLKESKNNKMLDGFKNEKQDIWQPTILMSYLLISLICRYFSLYLLVN